MMMMMVMRIVDNDDSNNNHHRHYHHILARVCPSWKDHRIEIGHLSKVSGKVIGCEGLELSSGRRWIKIPQDSRTRQERSYSSVKSCLLGG